MSREWTRRRALRLLAAGAIGGALPIRLGAADRAPAPGTMDYCTTPSRFDQPLHVPGRDGLQGRLHVSSGLLALQAVRRPSAPRLALFARVGGRDYVDPTMIVERGTPLRIALRNTLDEPTILHWHGLTIDTANDGNGETLALPGNTYDYAFTVHNRAGLYWYHPHPHGATAGQAYRGMFGLLAVEDDEERALRKALQAVAGETEILLVLHDRRSGSPRYAPSSGDSLHGWYGDESLVNFTARPYFDVAQTRYRFRVLNASNARIYRLGLRNGRGDALSFSLIGTDGGLLESPRAVNEVFVAPAERVDLVVDFSTIAIGGVLRLESRAFDPMHGEVEPGRHDAAGGTAHDHSHHAASETAHDHSHHAAAGTTHDHSHHAAAGGSSAPASASDGAPFALLQFNVRRRGRGKLRPLPARLSEPTALAAAIGDERPLHLGFIDGRWRINDLVYDARTTPIVVAKNAVETWLLTNEHTSMPHALHLHGFQFRVLERATSPAQLAPLVVDANGRLATDLGWKDTILVWPGESVRIRIDFRHPFDGDQIYLVHCHNLEHEDGGMMLRVKVG